MNTLFILILLMTSCLASATQATDPSDNDSHSLKSLTVRALKQKADELSQTIKNSRYEVSLDSIPSTAGQNQCNHPPDILFLTGAEAGNQRIKIECTSPKRWSVYARGNIRLFVSVLVSRRALARGETIQPADVTLREQDIGALRRGYLLNDSILNNKQLTRRINAGDVITPKVLRAAHLIRRGDRIVIVADNGSFTITMPGKAMEDGRLNQQIRVRNLSSGKTIQGTVSGSTEVTVL